MRVEEGGAGKVGGRVIPVFELGKEGPNLGRDRPGVPVSVGCQATRLLLSAAQLANSSPLWRGRVSLTPLPVRPGFEDESDVLSLLRPFSTAGITDPSWLFH